MTSTVHPPTSQYFVLETTFVVDDRSIYLNRILSFTDKKKKEKHHLPIVKPIPRTRKISLINNIISVIVILLKKSLVKLCFPLLWAF